MRRPLAMLAATALLGLPLLVQPLAASASSHREAPTIAEDPVADNTDVYAFTSPDRPDTVTLLANYIPFENPAGGPNFYRFGDDVRYDIHIDNVGDAQDHIVFSFFFSTATLNPNTFLYNDGRMTFANGQYTHWNRPQTYTLQETINGGTPITLGQNLLTPPDNVGPRSVGSPAAYDTLAKSAIAHVSNGITSFAGQRSEQFFLDLGGIFDLLGVAQPFGTAAADSTAGMDVNTLALQVPKALLEGPNNDHVIGVWATSSRHSSIVRSPTGGAKTESPDFVQVSRLGNPLVNEVVIPLGQKDRFNASTPSGDSQFLSRVTNSELAGLLNSLYGAGAPTMNRSDLVTVFLTGVPGLNMPKNPNMSPGDELRLNMSTPVTTKDPNAVNRLGLLAGQADGFPNGRRPADDVVDIELQAVDGILCQQGGALQGSNPPCRSGSVPAALGDGVNQPDVAFQSCFPYLANPHGPDGAAPVSSCPSVGITGVGNTGAQRPIPVAGGPPLGLIGGSLGALLLVALGSATAVIRRRGHHA